MHEIISRDKINRTIELEEDYVEVFTPCIIFGENIFFDGHRTFRWFGEIIFIAPENLSQNFFRIIDHWLVGILDRRVICIDKRFVKIRPWLIHTLPNEILFALQ